MPLKCYCSTSTHQLWWDTNWLHGNKQQQKGSPATGTFKKYFINIIFAFDWIHKMKVHFLSNQMHFH